jgi:molecular chaperone Hsp33
MPHTLQPAFAQLPDIITPFQLETGTLRGRFVRMGAVLDEILLKHDYPYPVARLLAEMVVTGTALAAMLKFEGRFTLQAKGDGAVTLLVADTTNSGGVRAYAKFDPIAVARMGDEGIGLLGKGHLAFTIEPPADSSMSSYQGIVPLRGNDIASAAQNYFRQSEQIPTGLMTAVLRDDTGHWGAACLIVQQMPDEGGLATTQEMTPQEFWQHVMVLMSSCTVQEMLDPAIESTTLLYRLFHGENVRAAEAQSLQHVCNCAMRIQNALRLFSPVELADMAVHGVVTMTCQFCNSSYHYDEAEIAAICAEN